MFEDITKKESNLRLKILSLEKNADKEKLFNEIDDEILKIKQDINCCYDNMGITLDIINNADFINNSYNDSILGILGIKQNDLRDKSSKLKTTLSTYYTDKGNYFQKDEKCNEALDAWEEVLKTEPGNDYIHSKLIKIIIDQNNDIKNRAEYLKDRYRFKYIGSFGNDKITKPVYMCASETKKIMFVSDYESHKIHKFTFDGEYIGRVPVEIETPIGLFLEGENKLWICDFGNSRILCTDFNGKVLEKININQILNKSNESMNPAFGCVKGDRIYLTLLNNSRESRMVISFNKNSPFTFLEKLSIENLPSILEINFINNALFAANYEPGMLFTFNPTQKQFVQFADIQLLGNVKRFIKTDDGLFVICDKQLLKIDSKGKLIYSADLEKILKDSSQPTCMAILKRKKKLFIADYFQNSIHMFSI